MMTQSRPSAFSNMNKPRYIGPDASGGYKSWKKQTEDGKEIKKEVNIASFSDFPDLVQNAPKKTVFEGNSLASKLKEVIAAEEEAAILKRLKKGDTPEMIFREACTILPLKNSTKSQTSEPLEVPWWVMDTTQPTIFPPFRPKSVEQLAEERKWKRLGINPNDTMLFDESDHEDYIPDTISMPASDIPSEDESEEEMI